MITYNRWATPDEVEEQLNGEGIDGAAWILMSGEISDGTAQFDLSIPIFEENF